MANVVTNNCLKQVDNDFLIFYVKRMFFTRFDKIDNIFNFVKGFLVAFFVFVFWASGGIYYISKANSEPDNIKDQTTFVANTNKIDKLSPEIIPEPLQILEVTSEQKEEIINPNQDSLVVLELSSNSQLLAQELKKSITISDTIDINQGEPELTYEEEILEEEAPAAQLFYPRYTKSAELILDTKLVDYAKELKVLLKENPDKKITITGHTDNIGNAKDNFAIALKKSRQVKWYLTARKGLPRSRIKAISKGEIEPIESNNSNWGRKKNNRIEIIVE